MVELTIELPGPRPRSANKTVGSACRRMLSRSRLIKTPATCGRSSSRAVSFSTIEGEDRRPGAGQQQIRQAFAPQLGEEVRHAVRRIRARSAPGGFRHSCKGRYRATARLRPAPARGRRRAPARRGRGRQDFGAGKPSGISRRLTVLPAARLSSACRSRSRRGRETRIRRPSPRCRARTVWQFASNAEPRAGSLPSAASRSAIPAMPVWAGTTSVRVTPRRAAPELAHRGRASTPAPPAPR